MPRRPSWPPHLTRRGETFVARVHVPVALRGIVTPSPSTEHISRSLKTRNETEAKRRLPIVVADIKASIEAARRAKPKGVAVVSATEADAAWWRNHRREFEAGDDGNGLSWGELLGLEIDRRLGHPVGTKVWRDGSDHPIFNEAREAETREFVELVSGARVPLGAELERYLAETKHSERYQSRIRLALKNLRRYLREERLADDLKEITKRRAGRFIEWLGALSPPIASATVMARTTALSSYWRWMVKKGEAEQNPWPGQAPVATKGATTADTRPFTDAEMITLLTGNTYSTLQDMMRLAALSGLRIGEIGRLTAADCEGGFLTVRDGKTASSNRSVPIHPDLASIVARRTAGKGADTHLMDELRASPKQPRDRAAKATERFTAYREGLGIAVRPPGQRQADATFHSFRRWFITKAEQAGNAPHLIEAVAGHKRQGESLGRYSAGPSAVQLRAVVESVRLPPGAPIESPPGPRMGEGRKRNRASE